MICMSLAWPLGLCILLLTVALCWCSYAGPSAGPTQVGVDQVNLSQPTQSGPVVTRSMLPASQHDAVPSSAGGARSGYLQPAPRLNSACV